MSRLFADKYKTLSDAQLIAILHKGEDYVPEALEAAQAELNSRQLTDAQLEEARLDFIDTETAEQQKAPDIATSLYNRFSLHSLLPENSNQTDKRILSITTWYILIKLLDIYTFYKYAGISHFKDVVATFHLAFFLSLNGGYVTLAYFFYKRRRVAWIILATLLYLTCWSELGNWCTMAITWMHVDWEFYFIRNWGHLIYIGSVILVLYLMHQPRMRVVYKITKKWKNLGIFISLGLYITFRLLGFWWGYLK